MERQRCDLLKTSREGAFEAKTHLSRLHEKVRAGQVANCLASSRMR
jgi:hypothetical protein